MPLTCTKDVLKWPANIRQLPGAAVAGVANKALFGVATARLANAVPAGLVGYPVDTLVKATASNHNGTRAGPMEKRGLMRAWRNARLLSNRTLAEEFRQWAFPVAGQLATRASEDGCPGYGGDRSGTDEKRFLQELQIGLTVPATGSGCSEARRTLYSSTACRRQNTLSVTSKLITIH